MLVAAFIAVCILWAGDGEVVADLGGGMVGADLGTAEGCIVSADQGGAVGCADMAARVAGCFAVALALATADLRADAALAVLQPISYIRTGCSADTVTLTFNDHTSSNYCDGWGSTICHLKPFLSMHASLSSFETKRSFCTLHIKYS